jgi:hypothetical protein
MTLKRDGGELLNLSSRRVAVGVRGKRGVKRSSGKSIIMNVVKGRGVET